MRTGVVISLFLVPVVFWMMGSVSASAQSASLIDLERHDACLSFYSYDPEQCFFHVSTLCQMEEIERAANPLRARMWCDFREMDAWVRTSDAALEELLHGLPDSEADVLRQQQARWSGGSLYCWLPRRSGEPALLIQSEQQRCALREVQMRGLYLLTFLAVFQAGRFDFQQGDD